MLLSLVSKKLTKGIGLKMTNQWRFTPTNLKKMKNTYDLIIVGSGSTGLSAAIQATELGYHPVILEKMKKIGGNTVRASSGMNAAESDVQLKHGVIDTFQNFYQETNKAGGLMNQPDLLKYFVQHAALSIDWLRNHGIILDDLTISGAMSVKRTHRPASMAPIGGFLINGLLKIVDQENIPLFTDVQVSKLLYSSEEGIKGVEVSVDGHSKRISAKAVILATGGFGASKRIIGKYRPDLISYKTTNQPGATGDGLLLADKIGAQLIDMNFVQVHPTAQQDTPHVYLIGEALRGEGAILINANGDRFVNELATRKLVSEHITALPEKSAYLIFDQAIRDRIRAVEFYDSVGLVKQGESLTSLADQIGVPKRQFEETVSQWNAATDRGVDTKFNRTTGLHHLINHGPFFAIHVAPAIHFTLGGIHINERTQVIDTDGNLMAGLYAAGEVAGGLHGNNRIGGNSIAETVIFGRQAGIQAVSYLRTLK